MSTFNRVLFISGLALLIGVGAYFYSSTTSPTFTQEIHQLTERLEVGVKYTEAENDKVYMLPYVKNPNNEELTFTHQPNFIEVQMLNTNGEVVEDALYLKDKEEENTIHSTRLEPGERYVQNNYYVIDLSTEAISLQLSYDGQIDDEFGYVDYQEDVAINIQHLGL
ncbi:hypothetical protein [Salsuginibacillus kocurii]|uniref:hypothetical protein n=1 Tax=Salsuginibacillus kocurii TaxID=427078 RepID=UPI00035D7B44|nr:hypothetical protein [Salsuginibacillus kocurii]